MAHNGIVQRIVSDRGFGFITGDDTKEYFFHRSGLDASLAFERLSTGDRVSFDTEASDRGMRAVRVRAEVA